LPSATPAAVATGKPKCSCSNAKEEELAGFRKRLDSPQLTDAVIQSALDRIGRAFERGEAELMIASFPAVSAATMAVPSSMPVHRPYASRISQTPLLDRTSPNG
jgi:hypothetical protein